MSMIIDANMHFVPPTLLSDKKLRDAFMDTLPVAYGQYGFIRPIPGTKIDQIVLEWPKGIENLNFGPHHIDPSHKLAAMKEAGVDRAILRTPCWHEWLDLELCQKVNDDMAEFIKANPGKFYGLGIVPPWGKKDALKEAERCIEKLGFIGMEVAAHYGTLYLDEEEFRPYFKFLNKLNVPVVVHHTPLPVDHQHMIKYTNLRRQFGRCVDQATGVGREIFSDMFAEMPNLKFVHTMMGGGFFTYVDMIIPRKSRVKEEMERFDTTAYDKMHKYLKNNLYFETSHPGLWGKYQLESAIKILGADHVLFGCSYPVRREWLIKGVEDINALDISKKDKDLILGGSAKKLFNLK
jgi:predicted TIM-barrel fold metal-dependent hydrolase